MEICMYKIIKKNMDAEVKNKKQLTLNSLQLFKLNFA